MKTSVRNRSGFEGDRLMRRLGPLTGLGNGLKRLASAAGRAIGMLEVAIGTTGYGAYLVALGFLEPRPAAGVGLVVAGGMTVAVHLAMDALSRAEGKEK